MGWYGIFLIRKLKFAFSLRKFDQGDFEEYCESIDRFIDKRDKLMEDIEEIQISSENEEFFSTKTTAKMFNIISAK